jgi:hypothetical protein
MEQNTESEDVEARELLRELQEHEESTWQALKQFDRSPAGVERAALYAEWSVAYTTLENVMREKGYRKENQ